MDSKFASQAPGKLEQIAEWARYVYEREAGHLADEQPGSEDWFRKTMPLVRHRATWDLAIAAQKRFQQDGVEGMAEFLRSIWRETIFSHTYNEVENRSTSVGLNMARDLQRQGRIEFFNQPFIQTLLLELEK